MVRAAWCWCNILTTHTLAHREEPDTETETEERGTDTHLHSWDDLDASMCSFEMTAVLSRMLDGRQLTV